MQVSGGHSPHLRQWSPLPHGTGAQDTEHKGAAGASLTCLSSQCLGCGGRRTVNSSLAWVTSLRDHLKNPNQTNKIKDALGVQHWT